MPECATAAKTGKCRCSISPESIRDAHTKLTYTIIDALNYTYGYDVLADGRLMIHQKSIPAMAGNEGFKSKADAEKVAQ